jgi:hypothetical protein
MFAAGPHFDTARFEEHAASLPVSPQHPVQAVDGYLARLSATHGRLVGVPGAGQHESARDLARTADRTVD